MAGPDDPPDDPPAPPAADAGADEPRARDVAAAKSTADLEQKLDPQTIAQLAAWFGLPSFQQLEEERAAAQAPTEDSAWEAERREVEEKIDAVVDQELLARIERWRTDGDAMFDPVVPPELHLVENLVQFDHTFVDRLGIIADGRELERPRWIDEELKDTTPQAMLRDLYRSETVFQRYLTQQGGELGMLELIQDARAPMTMNYSVRPEPPVRVLIAESLAELVQWKAAPWDQLDLPEREKSTEEAEAPDERDWSRFSGEPSEDELEEEPEEDRE